MGVVDAGYSEGAVDHFIPLGAEPVDSVVALVSRGFSGKFVTFLARENFAFAEFGELAAGPFVPGVNLLYLAGCYPIAATEKCQEFIDAAILFGINVESRKF